MQFAILEELLDEIKSESPRLNVEIVGINRMDQASNNGLVTSERKLPWLQDSLAAGQWSSWEATWRDVRIVDSETGFAGLMNLTGSSLSLPDNRAALKGMLLKAGEVADEDGDGLRDDWERLYLGDDAEASGPNDDLDKDGYTNFEEYAFGSDPALATSVPEVIADGTLEVEGEKRPTLRFRRRAGANATYTCQQSDNLLDWELGEEVFEFVRNEPVFDGSGTFYSVFVSKGGASVYPQRFFRVLAE